VSWKISDLAKKNVQFLLKARKGPRRDLSCHQEKIPPSLLSGQEFPQGFADLPTGTVPNDASAGSDRREGQLNPIGPDPVPDGIKRPGRLFRLDSFSTER